MAGPWERYQQQPAAPTEQPAAKPWERYAQSPAAVAESPAAVSAPVAMPEPAAEPSLWDAMTTRFKAGLMKPIGGTQQMLGEGLDQMLVGPRMISQMLDVADAPEAAQDMLLVNNAGLEFGQQGADIARMAGEDAQWSQDARGVARPTSFMDALTRPGNAAEYYGGMVVESLPAMMAAMATRNPELAAGVAGESAGATQFADSRADGRGFLDALKEAAAVAMTESALSQSPFGEALSGKPLGARLARTTAAEAGTEGITNPGQMAMVNELQGKPQDAGETLNSLIDSLIVGGVMGPTEAVLGGGREAPDVKPGDIGRDGPDMFRNPPPVEPGPDAPDVGVPPEATDDLNAMLEAAGVVEPAPALEPKQPPVRTEGAINEPDPAAAGQRPQAPEGYGDQPRRVLLEPDVAPNGQTRTDSSGRPMRRLGYRTEQDDLLTWVASQGGVDPAAMREAGIDPAIFKGHNNVIAAGVPNGTVIREGGMTADQLRERMQESEWLKPEDEWGTAQVSANDALDLLREGADRRVLHPLAEGTEAIRQNEASQYEQELADWEKAQELGQPAEVTRQRESEGITRYENRQDAVAAVQEALGESAALSDDELDRYSPRELADMVRALKQDRHRDHVNGVWTQIGNSVSLKERTDIPPVRAALDLDNFKTINDTHGHAMGDAVLIGAGKILGKHLGNSNAFRMGGDEFVAAGKSPAELETALRAAQDELAQTRFVLRKADGTTATVNGVGISFGIGNNLEEADAAQYRNKQERAAAGLRTERRAGDRREGQDVRAAPEGGGVRRGGERDGDQPGRDGDGVRRDGQPRQVDQREAGSGVSDGEPKQQRRSEQTDASRRLNWTINKLLKREGRGREQFRAREVTKASLPDALNQALDAIEQASGAKVVVFENLTPDVDAFNGVLRHDGTIYIDQDADMPATLVASHEFVHELRQQDGALYDELAAEVRRQGNLPAWIKRMERERNRTDEDGALEELVADAAADAMTDTAFLDRMAKESPTLFRHVAEAFRRFLDTLLGKVENRGTNAYLKDVEAFRDKLLDVLRRYETGKRGDGDEGSEPRFQRRTRQQAEQEAETLRDAVAQTLPVNRGTAGWSYDAGKWEGRKGQLRKARAALDDKMISWRDAQDQIAEQLGKAIPDAQDVYRLENLMHGRVGEGIDQLEAKHIEPLVKAMRDAGVKLEQLEQYLYARHAEERNQEIAKINPKMPDGGSGMSTAEARKILANADRAKLDPLARRVDTITKATRKRLLDHGLITREQFDAMENQYSAYVPLRGKADQEIARQAGGAGRGLDTRPQPVKNALGRGDGNLAENILAEVFGDAQRSIILAEKARVGRAAMRLALANPNPALWQVEPVQVRRELDADGDVVERVVEDFSDPRVIAVRHQGKLYRLWIADTNMAMAMNNAGVESLNAVTRAAGAFNRYLSAVFTKYNPAFTPVNAARDAIFGLTGMAAEHGELAAMDAVIHYPQAAAAAWRHAANRSGSGDWDQWAREFANAGGKTGYVNMPSVEDISRKIGNGGLRSYSPAGAARAAKVVGDVVGNLNDAVENALRLSAYVTLRKRGASAEQAAAYAKDLTVNFNRKGNMGSALNAWFLFYNASMQGAKRASTVLRKPKTMAYLGTLAAAQVVSALAMMGMKDEDDDESLWDKTPDYVKRRNLVIPVSSDHILTIPMPYGFNLFTYLAGKTAGWAKDGRKPNESAAAITGDVLSAAVESFSPVPLDDGALGLLPTALRIPTNLSTNRNDFGNRIRNENPYSKSDVPLAAMGRPDTLEVFKLISTGLNRIGGGDDFTPPVAALDWAPEDIEYLVKTLSGGTGKFIVDVATVGEAAANGEDLTARDVPITSRFVSNIDQQAAQASAYYNRRESIDRAIKKLRATYRSEGYEAAKQLIEDTPELHGITFKRRKTKSKNGPKGGIVETDGSPQLIATRDDSVYGRYKAAEKKIRAINDAIKAEYAAAPVTMLKGKAGVERDQKIRELEKQKAEAQKALNQAWQKYVVTRAE